jgi:two-component system, cell cycle sensor histidine kinase and response regulator CckA
MTPKKLIGYLVVLTLGLNLLTLSLSGFFLAKNRSAYNDKAAITAQNLAQVLEQTITGTINKVDIAVYALAKEVERQIAAGEIDDKRLTDYMTSTQSQIPEIEGLRVANDKGLVIYGLRPASGALYDASEREYFIQLRDNPRDLLVISQPFKGRIANKWIIVLARRISRPDGTFAGVAFGSLSLAKIDQLFSSLNVGRYGAFALRDGADLGLVARYPEPEGIGSAIGLKKMSREFLELFRKGETAGVYDAPSGLDRRMRTWGFRKFANARYYIFVGLAKDEYLAGWRRDAWETAIGLALFLLVSSLAAAAIALVWKRNQATEESLRVNEARFHKIFEESPIGISLLGKEREFVLTNQRYREFLGYSEAELMERGPRELLHPDDREPSMALSQKLREGDIPFIHMEQRYLRKDGRVVWSDTTITPLRDEKGQLILTIGWVQDITERKQSEEKVRKLSQAVEQSPASIAITDRDGNIEYVNPAFCTMTGYPEEELLGKNPRILKTETTSSEEYRILWETITSGRTWQGEFCNRKKDGELFWESACIAPISDDKGAINHFVAIKEDITQRRRAEEERAALEGQLRQAQKMESVGRLAGGVAHDFNNMLTVILGHAALALMEAAPSHPLHVHLSEIHRAAERSTDLTRQLLAFARKQTIAPKVLDLNASLTGMLNMLQRLIGEDILLSMQASPDLWPVKVDPSQIDQILANLCVNARDAMTGVGTITLQTVNRSLTVDDCIAQTEASPGEYVLLTLTDDGSGMEQEMVSHIFEPFFTTKGVGEGTGLGLSTVYGIVKQNNGFIEVHSHPDRGTTFNIYLPRYAGAALQERTSGAPEHVSGRSEVILVVEDESTILSLVSKMLTTLGYSVLQAGTPTEAIDLVQQGAGKIHLLLTDVVMPGMNGRDLANRLLDRHPRLKMLFMSGYTADIIARHGVLDDGINFIQKPFTMQDLAGKLVEVLGREDEQDSYLKPSPAQNFPRFSK